MILEVQHETQFTYPEAVTEAVTELRMEPVSDDGQSCRSFHLTVSPTAEISRYQDGFGNRVHHFNLLGKHQQVRILAAAIVDTHARPHNPALCRANYPIEPDRLGIEVLDFMRFRGPVRRASRLGPILDALQPRPGTPLTDVVSNASHYIHERFEYARDVTLSSSPIDHVLEHGKGVCQDFTHLLIAVLRAFGVPARYVSGYIHRADKQSQSHAWCEAWLPDGGWVGIDPTNDCFINEHFIKVAVGRDFTDVPPNKGVYRGRAVEAIHVRVATRELQFLPSLSWQEQLPPLDMPLTYMRRESGPMSLGDQEAQQQ